MKGSAKIREARKAAQMERLGRKGDDDYSEFYRSQPLQIQLAEKNREIKASESDVRDAAESLQLAQTTGNGIGEAMAELTSKSNILTLYKMQKGSLKGSDLPSLGGAQ